jgi:hypothetical protein
MYALSVKKGKARPVRAGSGAILGAGATRPDV